MMFACAFPLAFAFATLVNYALWLFIFWSSLCFVVFCILMFELYFSQNNITEIRADALKLLAMLRRANPRFSTSIGAWLNIFQVLMVYGYVL